MGRPHRFIDNESGIVELTSRCVQGRFLMRTSSLVNDRILGIIGYAQRMTGARLFIFNVQSNQDHALGQFNGVEQMEEFERLRKSSLAKELGDIHDWKEKFWGRRYNSISLGDSELTQQKRLRYVLANGVKDGLIDSPLEWPGVSPAWHLSNGIWTLTGTRLDRSDRKNGPKLVEETVQLSPMPFMEHWSPEKQRQWFRDTIRDIEDEARERRHRENRRSVGVAKILRFHPHDKPAEFKPTPAPLFHASSPEEKRKLRYARELKEVAYQCAAEKMRGGEPCVLFPDDCFLPPHVIGKRGPPS